MGVVFRMVRRPVCVAEWTCESHRSREGGRFAAGGMAGTRFCQTITRSIAKRREDSVFRFSCSTRALWFLGILLAPKAFSACDKCQRPQVIQFDLRVVPARPSDSTDPQLVAKILEWKGLFWTSAGVKGYLSSEDPTRECFTHLDGSFWTKGDTASHGLKFGDEWSNLPPASGRAGGDYLVSGSVDGSNGAYTAEVQLQTSKTREVVATASKSFTSSDEPLTVGKHAASALGPIVDKIRAFEKSKRASGDPYALGPTAELHPAKTDLKEGESTEVELWLYDCDGDIASSPLANRPVRITATNGTLSETSLTTGADGKAKFTFTAGSKPAEALLTATYPFTFASGHESYAEPGYASIRIQEVPATLWKLQGSVITQHTYDEVKKSSYAQVSEGGHSSLNVLARYKVSGVLKNVSKDSASTFKSDLEPVQLLVEGTHTEDELAWGFFQSPNAWSKRQTYQTVYCLPDRTAQAKPDVSFNYFYEPGIPRRAAGRFSMSGVEIRGDAKTTGSDCNSQDGCKAISIDDEATDEVSLSIPVPDSAAGTLRDTSYVDMAGIQITENSKSNIRYVDGTYRIELLSFQQETKNGEGTVANVGYTSTIDRRYSFTLSPMDNAKSALRMPARSRLGMGILDADVQVGSKHWVVDFRADSPGVLQARLLDLSGQILAEGSRGIAPGSRSEMFDLPLMGQRLLVSEVVFTSSTGLTTRRVQRHLVMESLPNFR